MRQCFLRSALVLFLVLVGKVLAKSSSGDAVLVLLDPSLDSANYSIFFNGLEKRGYDLTFRTPKDVSPAIPKHDVPHYSHVIPFTPDTKTYAPDITPQSLVGLLSKNTNLIIAFSSKQTPLTFVATEFSLILPPKGTLLLSHHPKRPEPANIIPVSVPESPILTPGTPPVWFSGIPHALGNNPRLVPLLRAPEESFAADSTDDSGVDAIINVSEKGDEGLWEGSQMGLVTGFQSTKNSRVVFAGSVELFSDEYARKELPSGLHSGNAQFVRDVAAWVFQETLTLRIDRTEHHRVNEIAAPEMYTVNDQIVYTAYISAYDRKTSSWKPYSGIADMQLDFTMLGLRARTALPPVASEPGKYEVQFRAPGRQGVLEFVVDWRRAGYSFLHITVTVPVVPFRHNQRPRFLNDGWSYYAGAIGTSVVFLFAALWFTGYERAIHTRTFTVIRMHAGTSGHCIICGALTNRRCSLCLGFWYCSSEHQKVGRKTHKSACNPHNKVKGIYFAAGESSPRLIDIPLENIQIQDSFDPGTKVVKTPSLYPLLRGDGDWHTFAITRRGKAGQRLKHPLTLYFCDNLLNDELPPNEIPSSITKEKVPHRWVGNLLVLKTDSFGSWKWRNCSMQEDLPTIVKFFEWYEVQPTEAESSGAASRASTNQQTGLFH
ncbi:hypothetical protein BS17DRAFT_733825 [Gyrodon lividus]|nr:hypothetical protein BS17DRAFT_733825 [Gyrodon lividus]